MISQFSPTIQQLWTSSFTCAYATIINWSLVSSAFELIIWYHLTALSKKLWH